MDQQRQQAFEKLRSPCVKLSSIALKFEGHQVAVKEVLRALEEQFQVLRDLGSQSRLDEKLASYAIWPLTKVFNQSQTLSSRCMQVAIQSVDILVSQGWRQRLEPGMGKQLLILMSLLSGSDPRKQTSPPDDELKSVAFKCMETLIHWLSKSPDGKSVFQDQSARNIVDQLAYLLVENLTDSESDTVQVAAAEALLELNNSIANRIFLASLLPRSVSSLTKALRPSTKVRRTRKVFVTDLQLLRTILRNVLADSVVASGKHIPAEQEALDESWLKATAAQVKNALSQVTKLRSHDQFVVRHALFDLCMMIVEDCNDTLRDSIPIIVETLVVLASNTDDETAISKLKYLVISRPEITEMLQSNFYDWSQSLPRVIQGNDDKPKELMLARIKSSFEILRQALPNIDNLASVLSTSILRTVTNKIQADHGKSLRIQDNESNQYSSLLRTGAQQSTKFELVLFSHQSERESMQNLYSLIDDLRQHSSVGRITQDLLDSIWEIPDDQKLGPIWLSLQLLKQDVPSAFDLDEMFITSDSASAMDASRTYLVHNLYTQTKEILLNSSPYSESPDDPRLVALALESLVCQAKQLGGSYRGELYQTLYPVLALLSSKNSIIQNHAITTLNLVASSCQYASVSALLIENVDYLVNSIGWKLNTFNLSPEAPVVLNMVLKLVGSRPVPHLDDLIASIFAALDSFHGYTQWVEILFEVLGTIVDESVKVPDIAITDGKANPQNKRTPHPIPTVDDIVSDIRARKKRRLASANFKIESAMQEPAPHRAWTAVLDDPNHRPDPTEGKDIETLLREANTADEENDLPAPNQLESDKEEDSTTPKSKVHDLLLQIARSTVPHLSSPSPRVRHVLLQILAQITPLLARHENTFLPLINSIWPGVVQRFLAPTSPASSSSLLSSSSSMSVYQSRHDEGEATGDTESDLELPYNTTTAAEVISLLCQHSGDFMASRVGEIWTQLKSMYMKAWNDVESQLQARQRKDEETRSDHAGKRIAGPVNLQVIKNDDFTVETTKNTPQYTYPHSSPQQHRTTQSQIMVSLVNLYLSILTHVRISENHIDDIFELTKPLLIEFTDLHPHSRPHPHSGSGPDSSSGSGGGGGGGDPRKSTSTSVAGWEGLANKVLETLTQFDPDRAWVLRHQNV